MFFSTFTPAVPGQTLPKPSEDYRTAEKIGPCKVTKSAVYLTDHTYILRSAITGTIADMGCAHVTGCCAGGVPVPRLVIITEAKKFPILCDKTETSEKLAALLAPVTVGN